jgi:hypothetical protein
MPVVSTWRLCRAVHEYLEGIESGGRPETMRKNISITDPAAEWTCAPGGPAFSPTRRTTWWMFGLA